MPRLFSHLQGIPYISLCFLETLRAFSWNGKCWCFLLVGTPQKVWFSFQPMRFTLKKRRRCLFFFFLTDQAFQGNHCICPAFFLYFAIVFYVLQSKGVVTEMVARLVLPPLNEHRMLSGPIGCVICQFGMVKCIPVQNQKSAHPPVDALLKIISTTHRITPVLHWNMWQNPISLFPWT